MSLTECIRDIYADNGYVVIKVQTPKDMTYITITIVEALDRAEAIRGLTTENERTKKSIVLYEAFMNAAMEARDQELELQGDEHISHAMEQDQMRRLEVYSINARAREVKVVPKSRQQK